MAGERKPSASKVGAHGPGDFDAILPKVIGARVKLTTSSPTTSIEGTLFAADPLTNLVAINTTNSGTSNGAASMAGDYHIVPISRIQSFNVLSLGSSNSLPADFHTVAPPIAKIDLNALAAREEAAIRRIKERDATRGKGVTREAQEIFDALARTLPTRWHETSIIVNDAVIIASPYGLENCSAPKEQQNALVRVRKVLENERKKIAERNRASPAPRKGG